MSKGTRVPWLSPENKICTGVGPGEGQAGKLLNWDSRVLTVFSLLTLPGAPGFGGSEDVCWALWGEAGRYVSCLVPPWV